MHAYGSKSKYCWDCRSSSNLLPGEMMLLPLFPIDELETPELRCMKTIWRTEYSIGTEYDELEP